MLLSLTVSSFTTTSPKIYILPLFAIASYEYECQYYDSVTNNTEKMQASCTVIWKYEYNNWKVINYSEKETDKLPKNISQDKLIKYTYQIVQEACWNCSNYNNSQFSELITEDDYKKLSIFHSLDGEIDYYYINRFAVTDFEINYTNTDMAVVNYVLLDDYGYSNYIVCWNLKENSSWRIVNVDSNR